MPANKKAYIRYKALDKCFRDWGKQYTWEKLQGYVERAVAKESVTQVSISTLRADVNFMKSEAGGNAPIKTYHDEHALNILIGF